MNSQIPFQITFRDMVHSDAVEQHARRRVDKLGSLFDRITACRVVIDSPNRHHIHGKRYNVRVELAVPGDEIVASRCPSKNLSHEDMHAAVEDAFDEAERGLSDYKGKKLAMRHEVPSPK